jgi:hypothetical protein
MGAFLGRNGGHSHRRPAAGLANPAPSRHEAVLNLGLTGAILKDARARLSGSGPRTHQDYPPAGATCCQSLLLDPNAIISIDLRKPLFLLVTGRGE